MDLTMIACTQCAASNTLDSSFCRRCGTVLPADAVTKGRGELETLIADGSRAFEDGRIDDAASIAEEAVLTDPASANAHALKGMVHERRGEVARALECYERVVELNPSSALDRIKLANLRQALADRATAAAPDRRVPMLAGLSAAALIVCAGVGFAKLSGNPSVAARPETKLGASTPNPVATNPGALESGTGAVASNSNPAAKPNSVQLGEGDVPPIRQGSDLATRVTSGGGDAPRGSLPRPRNTGGTEEFTPLQPAPVSGNVTSAPGGNGDPSTGSLPAPKGGPSYPRDPTQKRDPIDPAPQPQGPTPNTPTSTPTGTPKKSNDGVIQIEVGRGKGSEGGKSSGNEGSGGRETLRRVGDASMQSGDAARAASSYERARRNGDDDPSVNQRLAQAYERMGKKSEASAAYARAQQGYEARVKANPNDDRAKNGLSSVQQAQKVLNRS